MKPATETTLPDDPEELKRIIVHLQQEQDYLQQERDRLQQDQDRLQRERNRLEREQGRYEQEINLLHERIRLLYGKLFGKKSEKHPVRENSPQLPLFDMPEPTEIEPERETVEVPAHTRQKRGRKPLPVELPRVEVVHDVDEAEKTCGCGARLAKIGEEVSEKLDLIPAIIRVIRHIRPKYACKQCEGLETEGGTVKIAPPPPQIIDKGIATAGLLAHILTAKFCDALPFYRQEKQFDRLGADVGRATMCNWAMKAAEACQPVLDLLHREIRSGPLINIDETTVQVLDEPGRAATTKSFMWVCRGGPPGTPGFRYHYAPSRASTVARELLDGYAGIVQTDGYSGYDYLDHDPAITHAGCLAHVRRKFDEARRGSGKPSGKTGSADVALSYIGKLYRIESEAKRKGLTSEQVRALRQERAAPIFDDFRTWLHKKATQVVPKSLLGVAVHYALSQWDRLVVYLEHGAMTPDNNLAENAIRPFVVGRKNWLFAGTPKGARASADLYSLIETAKANGLEPYRYLRYLFEKLPFARSAEDYRALLPMRLRPEDVALKNIASGV
jgi:transposase